MGGRGGEGEGGGGSIKNLDQLVVLIALSPALIVPLPVNRFSNKGAPSAPNSILRNPPFCSLASF